MIAVMKKLFTLSILFILSTSILPAQNTDTVHVWEMQEITLQTEKEYDNNYTEVRCWIDLQGPDFSKRVYGFWDGNDIYKIRFVATNPGSWSWTSGSNQPNDAGLNAKTGTFTAEEWTEMEKQENPVRRGFIRATENGHALQYADGSPFFMVGDTWLAGSTWRLPFREAKTFPDYTPAPGMGFEDAVMYRKQQGFNSVSMISAFPNWDSDLNPSTYADENGIYIRNAWEKFGYDVAEGSGVDASGGDSYWGTLTAKNMRDEYGNLPFKMSKEHPGVSDFNRINPEYFQSLDKKMNYLNAQGFIPLLETIRRDVGPSWDAYFNFNESFSRFVQYLVSRYGAHNFVFSAIHLDWIPEDFSLTADQFNEALTYHLEKYGPMPFGQPVTVLIDSTTYAAFGHNDEVPWLTMHSVGNKPRDHRVSNSLETIFQLEPPFPAINFEPYYTGWHHEINKPGGEWPEINSERDNYFARSQMYGSVLSGGLSGHVHGTAAYDITTTGEPEGARPHIWEAFKYESANSMQHLRNFILSEGNAYQNLKLARQDLHPNKAPNAPFNGLDGWSYMMRNDEASLAFLYFENASFIPEITGFIPNETYQLQWFDTITGKWIEKTTLRSNEDGVLLIPSFPHNILKTKRDWAAKIKIAE